MLLKFAVMHAYFHFRERKLLPISSHLFLDGSSAWNAIYTSAASTRADFLRSRKGKLGFDSFLVDGKFSAESIKIGIAPADTMIDQR